MEELGLLPLVPDADALGLCLEEVVVLDTNSLGLVLHGVVLLIVVRDALGLDLSICFSWFLMPSVSVWYLGPSFCF